MPFRVTDATVNDRLASQIPTQHPRLASAQEQAIAGKRINRPPDDPHSEAAIIEIKTSQAALETADDPRDRESLSLETEAQAIESADFAEASTNLAASNRALEAILETGERAGRSALLDLIG